MFIFFINHDSLILLIMHFEVTQPTKKGSIHLTNQKSSAKVSLKDFL